MLSQLIAKYKIMPPVTHAWISTYDKQKVALYEKLGFEAPVHNEANGMSAWVLRLPLNEPN